MRQQFPETGKYAVYILKGLPFLPHYMYRNRYVAPGYRVNKLEYSSAELKSAGAIKEYWTLWRRGQRDD